MAKYDMEIATLSEAISNAAEAASDEAVQLVTSRYALDQLTNMYCHVKQFGVDRTFLRLYNSNHELDNALHMQFPSCESMNLAGDNSDMYSTAFITAMESEGEGLWATLKRLVMQIINWIRNKIGWVIKFIAKLFHPVSNKLSDMIERLGETVDGQLSVKHYSASQKALYYAKKAGEFFRNNWRIFAAIGSLVVEWRWMAKNRKTISATNDRLERLKTAVKELELKTEETKKGAKLADFTVYSDLMHAVDSSSFKNKREKIKLCSLDKSQARAYLKALKKEQEDCQKQADELSTTSVNMTSMLATISGICSTIGRDPNKTDADRSIVSIGTKIIALIQTAIAGYTSVQTKSARALAFATGGLAIVKTFDKMQSMLND